MTYSLKISSIRRLTFYQKLIFNPISFYNSISYYNNLYFNFLETLIFLKNQVDWSSFFYKTTLNTLSPKRIRVIPFKKYLFKSHTTSFRKRYFKHFSKKGFSSWRVRFNPRSKVPNYNLHYDFHNYYPLLKGKSIKLFTPYIRFKLKSLNILPFESPNFFFLKKKFRKFTFKRNLSKFFKLHFNTLRRSLDLPRRRIMVSSLISKLVSQDTEISQFIKVKNKVKTSRSFFSKKIFKSKRKVFFKIKQLSFLNTKGRRVSQNKTYKPYKSRILRVYIKKFRKNFRLAPVKFKNLSAPHSRRWVTPRLFSVYSFINKNPINPNLFYRLSKENFRLYYKSKFSLKRVSRSKRSVVMDFKMRVRKKFLKKVRIPLNNYFPKKKRLNLSKKLVNFLKKKSKKSLKYYQTLNIHYSTTYRSSHRYKTIRFKIRNRRLEHFRKFSSKSFFKNYSFKKSFSKKFFKKNLKRIYNRSSKFLDRFSQRFTDEFISELPSKKKRRYSILRSIFYSSLYRKKKRKRLFRKTFSYKPINKPLLSTLLLKQPLQIKKISIFRPKLFFLKKNLSCRYSINLLLYYLYLKTVSHTSYQPSGHSFLKTRKLRFSEQKGPTSLKFKNREAKKHLRRSLYKGRKPWNLESLRHSFLRKRLFLKKSLKNSLLSFNYTDLYPQAPLTNPPLNGVLSFTNSTTNILKGPNSISPYKNITHFFKIYDKLPLYVSKFNRFFNSELTYLKINSIHNVNFILSNSGFIFLNIDYIRFSSKYMYHNSLTKSRIYKNQLSFFYKNDLKRLYLRRPGFTKVIFYFSRRRRNYSRAYRYSFFDIDMPFQLSNNTKYNNIYILNRFFKNSVAKYRSKDFFTNYSKPSPLNRTNPIRKIRFKPGYQRIWRRARSSLNFNLKFHFRYQAKLTRKVTALRRLKGLFSIWYLELSLHRVLLNSRFTFDYKTSLDLVSSGLVFNNGLLAVNNAMRLFVNDFIQLFVSIKYYISYRWLNNWRRFNKLKLIKLINHKRNSSKYDLSKQVSRHLPDWVFNYIFKNIDIPKYLEVDFFTLSIFMVFQPNRVNQFNPLSFIETRHNIYTMYNWKYIT